MEKSDRPNIRTYLGFVITVLVLLVCLPSVLIYFSELNRFEKSLISEAQSKIEVLNQFIEDDFSLVLQDLEFISGQKDLRECIESRDPEKQIPLRDLLTTYGKIRKTYVQIRLVDTSGMEVLKASYDSLGIIIKEELYDISAEEYFKDIQILQKEEVDVSDYRLSSINGKLEEPHKPIIRFSKPLYSLDDTKWGYLIINYKADRVLKKMSQINKNSLAKALLSNEDGYWVKSLDTVVGFTYDLPGSRLAGPAVRYNDLWEANKDRSNGAVKGNFGLAYFMRTSPARTAEGAGSQVVRSAPVSYLMVIYPRVHVDGIGRTLAVNLSLYALGILALIIPILVYLFRLINRKNRELRRKSRDLASQNEELEDSRYKLERKLVEVRMLSEASKEALAALGKKEDDLSNAQEIAQLGYYESDLKKQRSDWSANLPGIFGLEDNYNFNDQGLSNVILKEDWDRIQEIWSKSIADKTVFKEVYRVRNKNGDIEYLQDIAHPLVENGVTVKMRGAIQNISERIRSEKALTEAKEKAESATRAKSDFLAIMSHEIRTPLNAVLGMANLLRGTELSPEQRDFVQTILISGDSLLSVINDILDFSRIESGMMVLDEDKLEINKLVEECLQVVELSAEAKNIKLFYAIKSDVPSHIVADYGRLRQALINLVNNAIKFTEKGEVCISVELLEKTGDHKSRIQFKVRDTGIGIPEDLQSKIFQAFEQADKSISRKYGGSGLGLAITKKLIETMGGKLQLQSKEGVGSDFFFSIEKASEWKEKPSLSKNSGIAIVCAEGKEIQAIESLLETLGIKVEKVLVEEGIPEKKLEAEKVLIISEPGEEAGFLEIAKGLERQKELYFVADSSWSEKVEGMVQVQRPVRMSWILSLFDNQEHTPQEAPQPERKNEDKLPGELNILVAEDNMVNQKLATLMFRNLGYDIDIANNGKEAVEAIRQQEYDLVFMDIQMPEMDGVQATQQIKKEKGEDAPPIIALTANAMAGDAEKYKGEGLDDYISKPMKEADIKDKIKHWLG